MGNSSKRIAKLIESVERSGLFASLLDLEKDDLFRLDEKIVKSVAGAANAGDVQLFDERDEAFLDTLDSSTFFYLQDFFWNLIPQLQVSHSDLMRLVHALVVKGKGDGAGNQPNVAFRDWCAKDPERSAAVIADARKGDDMAKTHLCFALEAAGDAETAIAFLSEGHDAEILIGAITALGLIGMTDNTAFDAAEVLSCIAGEHHEEMVRNNALVSVFSVLSKHTELDRGYGQDALSRASQNPTAETLHAIAGVLSSYGENLTEHELTITLDALVNVEPTQAGTLSKIDKASAKLIKAGRFNQLSNFIKSYIDRIQNAKGLATFERFRSKINKDTDRLGNLIIDWFVNGEFHSCSSLVEILSYGRNGSMELSLQAAALPANPNDQLYLCRRAVGYLWYNPVTAASIIVSVLRHGDPAIANHLQEILFDPLLLCYGGELREYLEKESAHGSRQGADVLKEVLKRKSEMLEAWDGIEILKELHPSESHRQLERVRSNQHMEESVREGRENSVLLSLVTTQTLLYGVTSSSYIPDPDGELQRMDMTMGEHSFTREYPQLDIFDPEGFQRSIFELKYGKRIDK